MVSIAPTGRVAIIPIKISTADNEKAGESFVKVAEVLNYAVGVTTVSTGIVPTGSIISITPTS